MVGEKRYEINKGFSSRSEYGYIAMFDALLFLVLARRLINYFEFSNP